MGRLIFRRLLQGIPTFFGITVIAFLIMMSAPGDPITLITFSPRRDAASVASMKHQLGLDQPVLTQYLYWLIGNDWVKLDTNADGTVTYGTRKGLLRGDLGESITYKQPVLTLIVQRIPATLLLTVAALIIGYGGGILLGVLAAVYHKTWIDEGVRIVTVVGNAVPAFWLGLIMIIVFSTKLDILPSGGMVDITSHGAPSLWTIIQHMIMPVFVLSLGTIAFVSRFMRTELLEVLTQDYVRTARSKGLNNNIVWWKHAARNALIPVATFVGPAIGTLLSGAVIIEQVFDWPGMGRLVVNSVFNRDYPLVMGSVVIASALFIFGLILSDIFYGLLDPRIRFR
ncbi:MAG TPA: ABC transporter permease [Phototrophicaceae bacterium]|nr:ABC transporter permease [Phototrophicaceae bacterium]